VFLIRVLAAWLKPVWRRCVQRESEQVIGLPSLLTFIVVAKNCLTL